MILLHLPNSLILWLNEAFMENNKFIPQYFVFQMPFFGHTVNKPFGARYHEQNKYTPHITDPEYLPPQIIPQRPAASLLNQMAYRASQKYDKSSKYTSSINASTPIKNNIMDEPEANSDVLFFPGQDSVACAGKRASSGKIHI